jgi:hypothetical protein
MESQPEEVLPVQAIEVPDWIKGLGEIQDIEPETTESQPEITPEA